MGQQIVVTNGAGGMPVVCLIEEEREKNRKALPYLYQALSLGVVKLCQGNFGVYCGCLIPTVPQGYIVTIWMYISSVGLIPQGCSIVH